VVDYLAPAQEMGVRFPPRPFNMKKESGKKLNTPVVILIIVAVILLIVGGAYSYDKYFKQPAKKSSTSTSSGYNSGSPRQEPVYGIATEEDYTNLEEVLNKNPLINELPDDSKIVLSFYNFYTGDREWEASYLLNKKSVVKGSLDDYDIKLVMHSKYITVLNENNLCDIIQRAQRNGDFGSETQASKLSLAWKYKSILDYKDCLGM
jgi:hypothetical protein